MPVAPSVPVASVAVETSANKYMFYQKHTCVIRNKTYPGTDSSCWSSGFLHHLSNECSDTTCTCTATISSAAMIAKFPHNCHIFCHPITIPSHWSWFSHSVDGSIMFLWNIWTFNHYSNSLPTHAHN
jgi:hypothetical protein